MVPLEQHRQKNLHNKFEYSYFFGSKLNMQKDHFNNGNPIANEEENLWGHLFQNWCEENNKQGGDLFTHKNKTFSIQSAML